MKASFILPRPDKGDTERESKPTNNETQGIEDLWKWLPRAVDHDTTLGDCVNANEGVLVTDKVTDEANVQELQIADDDDSSAVCVVDGSNTHYGNSKSLCDVERMFAELCDIAQFSQAGCCEARSETKASQNY